MLAGLSGLAAYASSLARPPGGPDGAITVIVPFPAGGTTDHLVRVLTGIVSAAGGPRFVVSNRPGGSTLIGARALRQAAPDGRTIGVLPLLLNRLRALRRTEIDLLRDYSFIARLVSQTHGLVARADGPLRSVADVRVEAAARPGRLSYATSGVASATHAAMEDWAERTGAHCRHVPYKGGAESLRAVLAGEVDLAAESPLWIPAVDQGRLRLLAIWNAERLARYPTVPTMAELGQPLLFDAAIGLGAPAGLDPAVHVQLRALFAAATRTAAFRTACDRLLAPVRYLDAEDFRAYAAANALEEAALVQRLGARLVD